MNNTLLSKDELNLYDYVNLRNIILDIFKLFKYLKRIDDEIFIPKITSDYRVRYEQFVLVRTSVVENYTLKSMMTETKSENTRKELLSKITMSLRKLNDIELEVFNLTFYQNKNEYEISDIICYGYKKVREIRKSACIKFLSSLGLDHQCFK